MKARFTQLFVALVLAAFLFIGACSKAEAPPMPGPPMVQTKQKAVADTSTEAKQSDAAGFQADSQKGENQVASAAKGRKLIREGQLSLQVTSIETAREQIEEIVEQAGGFISNVNFVKQSYRHEIVLQVRIPAHGFANLIERASKLGSVENEQLNIIDITDQYVDLERRIATQEKMAARLEKLIENSKYAFKDLLEVERELSSTQLEIERLKGSQRGYDDRVALSTLTITLIQEVDKGRTIAPPTSVFYPITNAIENASPRFKRSIKGVLAFFAGIVNFIIVIIPWLVVIVPAYLGLRWMIRRMKRSRKKEK